MPDYMFMLESRLLAEQRATMMRVQELAGEAGSNVYLTGGAVRDLISGMPIRDLDFTVEGNPSRLAAELEKGGAKIVGDNEKIRQVELIFSGDVEGSLSAAREDVYTRPGTKPDIRWSTIVEDLQRRDFSINAIAISLNPNSRGLLLDPTNGLADLENREVRALSIHSFTNQPVRLLRAVRMSVRMDFKIESRTEESLKLAMERGLHESITPEEAGAELRQLGSEQKPAAILKAWETRGLLGAISPQLEKRHPDYDFLNHLMRAREEFLAAGLRPRLFAPITLATLGKLSPKEQESTLERLGFRAAAIHEVMQIEDEAGKLGKVLAGSKTAQPAAAFSVLEKSRTDLLVYLLADTSKPQIANKIRNYLRRWRPLKLGLPGVSLELEALGMLPGPKFDKVMESFFLAQLAGKARTAEDRPRLLRKLAGIKEPPKIKPKEEKKRPGEKPQKPVLGSKRPEPEKVVTAAAGAKNKVQRPNQPPDKAQPALRKAQPAAARAKVGGARRS
jgi:tRNA nucleotidyltransferase (CCA-adding enzyme)